MNIKYRVWCKNNNEWEKDTILIAPDGKVFEILPTGRLIQVKEDTHIVQYDIGLKDCKGNEAYEGDILKEWFSKYSSKPQSTSYGIIKREEDTCNLYIEWHYERRYLGEFDGKFLWYTNEFPLRKVKELLVVGNIYQNKDLLKGED